MLDGIENLDVLDRVNVDVLDKVNELVNPNNPHGDTYETGLYFGYSDGFYDGVLKVLEILATSGDIRGVNLIWKGLSSLANKELK